MSVINFTNPDKAVAAQIERADGYVMRKCGGDTLQAGNGCTLKSRRFRRQEELGMLKPSGDALFDNMPSQAYRLQTANATTGSWTEDRIAALTRLWAEGWSASQIAERMGSVTRNAVISKARRLGLPDRKGKYQRKARPSKRDPRKHRRQTPPVHPWRLNRSSSNRPAPPPPTLTVIVGSVPAGERLSLLELTENTCRWPIGDPQDANFCFCGSQTSGNGPYCEYHARIAYQEYVKGPKR
jgi:GcrA cell cycle regulator